jgi:hypothetical protein
MNSLEKMVVAKQIKNITGRYDKDFKMLNTFTTVNGLRYLTALGISVNSTRLEIRRLHSGFL